MRRFLFYLVIISILPGCTPKEYHELTDEPITSSPAPWTAIELNSSPVPLEVPNRIVTVEVVGRYEPPDGVTWPAALDYRDQTAWTLEDARPVFYAATYGHPQSTVGDEIIIESEPASIYKWDIESGTIDSCPFEPQPSDKSWPAIPILSADGKVHFALVNCEGESTTRAYSVDGDDRRGIPIISSISVYSTDGLMSFDYEINPTYYELSPDMVLQSAERTGARELAFQDYRDLQILLPDDVTRFATNWTKFNLINGEITSLAPAIEKTYGAEFTGFITDPPLYFFAGEPPCDCREGVYISDLSTTIGIPGYVSPNTDEQNILLTRITGYIPSVKWDGRQVVFAEYGISVGDTTYIVAIMLNVNDLLNLEPQVIWASEVPNIFSISTVVRVGTESRPFIVCLDPLTGGLTVFDPLRGSIRHQRSIDLAEWEDGNPLASFCVDFNQSHVNQDKAVVYIHDPNANEIIELELMASEPIDPDIKVRITPLED